MKKIKGKLELSQIEEEQAAYTFGLYAYGGWDMGSLTAHETTNGGEDEVTAEVIMNLPRALGGTKKDFSIVPLDEMLGCDVYIRTHIARALRAFVNCQMKDDKLIVEPKVSMLKRLQTSAHQEGKLPAAVEMAYGVLVKEINRQLQSTTPSIKEVYRDMQDFSLAVESRAMPITQGVFLKDYQYSASLSRQGVQLNKLVVSKDPIDPVVMESFHGTEPAWYQPKMSAKKSTGRPHLA